MLYFEKHFPACWICSQNRRQANRRPHSHNSEFLISAACLWTVGGPGGAQNLPAVRLILPPHPGSGQTRKLHSRPNQHPSSPQFKLKTCLNLSHKGRPAHTHKSQIMNHNLVCWCSQGISMFVPVKCLKRLSAESIKSNHENASF